MRDIPRATVARLARYLQGLDELGKRTVSSADIALAVGVSAAQVRRDLSYLGHQGIRGVGYETVHLLTALRRELGLVDKRWRGDCRRRQPGTGAGWLWRVRGAGIRGGQHLRHRSRQSGHVRSTALVVRHLDDLGLDAANHRFAIAIIATPAEAAQEVLSRLADAGVRSVLNFAPAVLRAHPRMEVRNVDLSTELQILSFYRGTPAQWCVARLGRSFRKLFVLFERHQETGK